jgi:uncharacterized protein (TIGR03435 family)
MFSRVVLLFLAATFTVSQLTLAQTTAKNPLPTSSMPAFDVASIKPAKTGATDDWDSYTRRDIYTATNMTLKKLIGEAYAVPGAQILGIPPSLNDIAFDIEAKMDQSVFDWVKGLSREQRAAAIEQMIQQLLIDRFNLRVHTETRQLPVYALVVANPKRGTKLQPAQDTSGTGSVTLHRGQMIAKSIGSERLAENLTFALLPEFGRIVIDKTNLTGKYDLSIRWAADSAGSASDAEALPSIFTAIQEQLGLKLEATRAPVHVLIIDHIESPSAN